MKKEDFFEIMNLTDPALLERADRKKAVRPHFRHIKTAVILAATFLIAALICISLPMFIDSGGLFGTDSSTAPTNEIAGDRVVLLWGDVSALINPSSGVNTEAGEIVEYSFTEITEGKYKYYKSGNVIAEKHVGEKIDEARVHSGWFRVWDETETDIKDVDADVYEIAGISPDVAVCLRYLEKPTASTTEHYYVYYNINRLVYTDLSTFYAELGGAEHFSLSERLYYKELGSENTVYSATYKMNDGSDQTALLSSLISMRSHKDVGRPDLAQAAVEEHTERLQFNLNVSSAGRTAVCYVLDNGYIIINGLSQNLLMWEIGEEAARGFIDEVKAGCELVYSSTDTASEQTVTATTRLE